MYCVLNVGGNWNNRSNHYVADGSYEDNAKAHCEELCKPSEPQEVK